MELQKLHAILYSLLSFGGKPRSDIAAKTRSVMGLEGSFIVDKKMVRRLIFLWVFSLKSNQCFDEWLRSITQYAYYKDLTR